MATPTSSSQDVSTSLVPHPTHPVAGRSVTAETTTFEWTPIPDAESYRLQLAATDAFETIYYDETVEDTPSLSLADVLPDGAATVCWRVRAETGAETPWSPPARFNVDPDATEDKGQFRVDAPPVPIHPIEGDPVDPQAAAFTWEPVPEAGGYQVQVSATEAFNDPVVDRSFDRVTSLTLFDMLPADPSTLYWRVRALFPNGTEGPWSRTARFAPEAEPEATDVEATEEAPSPDPSSPKRSPVAAGPAQQARTSSTMAMTFVLVLVVSFAATILAIMWLQGTI